jgi:S1-C subfamily serine protease
MRSTLKPSLLFLFAVVVIPSLATAASAQTPPAVPSRPPTVTMPKTPAPVAKPETEQTDKAEKRRPGVATTRQARVKMAPDQERVAPQIVTVVHRLNGLTLLRRVLRESGEPGTVATVNPEAINNDAHASIIAGLALEDGRTVLARLPQVAAEIEVYRSTVVVPQTPKTDEDNDNDNAHAVRRTPRPPRIQPDLTVMTQDGRTFRARYIGIDGQTGLSVLQVTQQLSDLSGTAVPKILEGANVRVFAPEQVSSEVRSQILVRIGGTEAKISKAKLKAETDRVMLRAAKLSPNLLGGVACDLSGHTVGIIDEINGLNAKLVTADAARAAAHRVLEQQSSVPRPLLGIRGEEVEWAAKNSLVQFGWNEKELEQLLEKQIGIFLTYVLPGTPAAFANLHPGDIIVRVNDKDVKGAEAFSQMLTLAGTGEDVKFTVERPNVKTPLTFQVKLGGAFQPNYQWKFDFPTMPKLRMNGLKNLGIEAVALSNKSATQWGGQGVLVVSVEPESAAGRAGLKEGDVIEAIDGRTVGRGSWTYMYPFNKKEKHTFSVVRAKEKKQIVAEPVED